MHNGPAVERVFCVSRPIRTSHHRLPSKNPEHHARSFFFSLVSPPLPFERLYLLLLRQGYDGHGITSTFKALNLPV
jgi:hypothetical protein